MPKQHSEWRPAHTNFVPRSLILYGLASLSSNPLGSDRPSKRVNPATVSQTNHALHTTWHGCRSTAPVAEHRMNSPFGDQCWASEALLTGYHAQPTVRYSLLKGIKAFISIYLYIYILLTLCKIPRNGVSVLSRTQVLTTFPTLSVGRPRRVVSQRGRRLKLWPHQAIPPRNNECHLYNTYYILHGYKGDVLCRMPDVFLSMDHVCVDTFGSVLFWAYEMCQLNPVDAFQKHQSWKWIAWPLESPFFLHDKHGLCPLPGPTRPQNHLTCKQ